MTLRERVESQPHHIMKRFRQSGEGCLTLESFEKCSWVMIHPSNHTEWALPWSRFEAAHWFAIDRGERIEMLFTHHRAIADGENLKQLFPLLIKHELAIIRSLPAEFRTTVPADEVFITRLELKVLSENNPTADSKLPF